jgi:Flp pilus assembly protein TadD
MNGYKNTAELAGECDNKYQTLKERREEQERLALEEQERCRIKERKKQLFWNIFKITLGGIIGGIAFAFFSTAGTINDFVWKFAIGVGVLSFLIGYFGGSSRLKSGCIGCLGGLIGGAIIAAIIGATLPKIPIETSVVIGVILGALPGWSALCKNKGKRKGLFWTIFAVVGIICVVATTFTKFNLVHSHKDFFETGKSYFEAENYDEAIKYFSKAIKLKPEADYYHYRGNALDSSGEYGKALVDYSEAIRLNPTEGSYYFDRGNVYDAQKDYRRAAADYTKTIQLVPDEARYYNHRGNSRRLLEDYDNAIADYTQAIRLNPDDPRYRNNRGVSYLLKRDYDNAVANYAEAIRLAPDNARYYHNRGGAYNLKKDFARAVMDFTAAVRLDPDNGKYRSDLEKAESDWAKRGW